MQLLIEFFPFKDNDGCPLIPDDYGGRSRKQLLVSIYEEHRYETFKWDELGVAMESLLFAQEDLEERCKDGIPVVGIQTCSMEENELMRDETRNVSGAEKILNRLINRYLEYIAIHGFPEHMEKGGFMGGFFAPRGEDDEPITFQHNDRIKKVDFRSHISDWYLVDSVARVGVKEAIYALSVNALRSRGIDTEGFRLIRFIKRKEEDDLSVHFEDVLSKSI